MPSVITFDGHDGCGKSTLASRVADHIGGRVVKPFGGELGDHIAWLWRGKRFAEADALARASIERVTENAARAAPGAPLVFDRHWTTMFTVLPEEFWAAWGPLPPTVICHAETGTLVRRLVERGEDAGDTAEHEHYQDLYLRLAGRAEHSLVLDTTHRSIEDCAERAIAFWEQAARPGA